MGLLVFNGLKNLKLVYFLIKKIILQQNYQHFIKKITYLLIN